MSDAPAAAGSILVIEDDREIRQLLADFLAREGFAVETAGNGTAADAVLARQRPDLVVLDLMLPGEDGLSICRRLRRDETLPILMLTAKSDEIDRIVGLELGADDYLGKPFNPRELLARIRAILRRSRGQGMAPPAPPHRRALRFDAFVIDLDTRRLQTLAGEPVSLTAAEFDLLACFVTHPHRVLSRDLLFDWTRGRSADPWDRAIDVSVSRLRRKLDAYRPDGEALITTIRNGGYLFTAEIAVPADEAG